jgi:hypothetical protein
MLITIAMGLAAQNLAFSSWTFLLYLKVTTHKMWI